jgi:LacI family transcriptional regulator
MPHMTARLKDIANDLSVSVVTVSKVLRDHPDISPETKERVLRRMKELNYRPNLAARALVTGRTFNIGLVVPDLVHPFFSQVAKGLSGELRKNGYNLVISSSEEDPAVEQQEIEQLLSRRVDALIVASSQRTSEGFRRVQEQNTPYILIDRRFAGLGANFVGVDDWVIGDIATEHLIEIGCKRLAHIAGPAVSTAVGRAEGYRRTLLRHQIQPIPNDIITGEHGDDASDVSGYEAMTELLKMDPRPDGVFCYNDPTAMGAMKAILEAGLRVPEDIAIIGCGNVHYADFLRVPLTSIDQDCEKIGSRAAELAVSIVTSKGTGRPKSVLLEPRLIVRRSTQRIASASASKR